MQFFHPDKDFINWLIQYANGRTIIDVGCGTRAPLVFELWRNGYTNSFGIDPFVDYQWVSEKSICEFDNLLQVLPFKAEDHIKMVCNNSVLVINCRPCHSGFTEKTFHNTPKNTEFLYIGLERNLEEDLSNTSYTIIPHVGTSVDGEKVYHLEK